MLIFHVLYRIREPNFRFLIAGAKTEWNNELLEMYMDTEVKEANTKVKEEEEDRQQRKKHNRARKKTKTLTQLEEDETTNG